MGHLSQQIDKEKRRQQLVQELLDRLCRAECAKHGADYHYEGVERSIPIPGQPATYKAIATHGANVVELPLAEDATQLLHLAEAGAITAKEAHARAVALTPANTATLPTAGAGGRRQHLVR